ncbi:MAG: NAD-dependent epimerase/dehydratase family protein [Sphingobacteriaceae bacterium]
MMKKDKILVIGACGQIGMELTVALRNRYGNLSVIAADRIENKDFKIIEKPYVRLDVMDKVALQELVVAEKITQVYLLAAILSAHGEQAPQLAWNVNMQGLFNVLEIAREQKLDKVFWPSSIAVFGPLTPKQDCPQHTITAPESIYGISKCAGESWCNYYFEKFGVDVRSLRYPGLISYKAAPGGGTTDYAVEIFHAAVKGERYTCFLKEDAALPMMYMPDAIRATLELMDAPADKISIRSAYNLAGMSFTPSELASGIKEHIPEFKADYQPDFRQDIASTWPQSIDDSVAREDWNWKATYDLKMMVKDMLDNLGQTVN